MKKIYKNGRICCVDDEAYDEMYDARAAGRFAVADSLGASPFGTVVVMTGGLDHIIDPDGRAVLYWKDGSSTRSRRGFRP